MIAAATMAPAHLLDLPRELLDQIFSELCMHCLGMSSVGRRTCPKFQQAMAPRRRALSALSRTCRALHHLATPFLFHRLWAPHDRDAFRFLCALLRRPEHGSHVRVLDICRGGADSSITRLDSLASDMAGTDTHTDAVLFQRALARHGIVPAARKKQLSPARRTTTPLGFAFNEFAPENYCPLLETLFLLALALCPLAAEAHLMLFWNLMRFEFLNSHNNKTLGGGVVGFPSLRRLVVTYHSPTYGWFLSDIAPLVAAAPNLEALVCEQCMGVARDDDDDKDDGRDDKDEGAGEGGETGVSGGSAGALLQWPRLREMQFKNARLSRGDLAAVLAALRPTRLASFAVVSERRAAKGQDGLFENVGSMAAAKARGAAYPHLKAVAVSRGSLDDGQADLLRDMFADCGVRFEAPE
ncbi:hypothetical protein B0T26DRAFT_309186 [Lasiosphaeria miniovina]|uniref:F-box domain-containing protein n=1 Tax=Lasiosphaeria miniovina TaxID=1954250 RepID=A0AA40DW83_9PEZI|nr:uncharacterized protein B0T26DRAFT_309186 [Lasiosphaeria miniovina]KAK0717935.1 hypothetical protein B0T26DRAFT_309186 [Lasiosphaeria miniovina]